jgi:pimeloyl-ACP methyl ester carboxylesterase
MHLVSRTCHRAARLGVCALLVCSAAAVLASTAMAAPTPPGQSLGGPGGSVTAWASATTYFHSGGREALDYWTIEPRNWHGSGAAPTSVPVVVLLHGFGAANISYEQEWATHIAEEGAYVIYPRYQNSWLTTFSTEYTPNAITSIQQAISQGLTSSPVKPNPSLGMELVGYSAGGAIAANVANEAAAKGLPVVKALMLRNPWNGVDSIWHLDMMDASLANIPANVKLDCVVGNADTNVGRTGCDKIWERTAQVKSRNYIWMFSDAHGSPPLEAIHVISPANALVWRGDWKLADALGSCGIYGTYCDYAQGGATNQTSLGNWSDGVAVTPLSVTTAPPACPKGSTAVGC